MSLPGPQAESYNTDNGVRWVTTMEDQDASGNEVNDLTSNLIAYTGGSTTTHTWNKPVIGPAFTTRSASVDPNSVLPLQICVTAGIPPKIGRQI